jgi:drug/metabolite transporter (DMT)-like permease
MLKHKSHVDKGIAALVAVTATFALLSVLARYLNTDFTILQQVYLRVFAALVIAAVMFRTHIRWNRLSKLPLREWLILAFRGLVSYGVGVVLISKAANMTLIGHVGFIGALPFVPLLGFLFLKEKATWWKLLFIFGALLGVCLLSVNSPRDLLSWNTGDLLAIVASLGFAVGYVTRKWHSSALNNHEITLLTFLFGGGFVLLLSACIGEGLPHGNVPFIVWIGVIIGGILNVINLLLTNYGFEHVDAVRAGSLLNLESAWGLLFGLVLYHEWPTLLGLVGGLLIVACAVLMNRYSHRELAKVVPPENV